MTITTHLTHLCRRIRPTFNVLLTQRFVHQSPPRRKLLHKIVKPVTEESLRHTDQIHHGYQLIYKVSMDKYILALSIACVVTTCSLGLVAYQIYSENLSLDDLERQKSYGGRVVVSTNKYELIGFMLSLVGFNIAVSIMIRRLPLRIWKKGEKYVVVFEGHIPSVRRQFPFLKGQVEPIPAKGVLPWKDNRFSIAGQRAILLEQYFKTPSELHQMIHEKYRYY